MKHAHNCGYNRLKGHPLAPTRRSCRLDCECRCHHPLYRPAKQVVACWERGDLAQAVRQLARAVKEFEGED
jgi:hypothetical protein